MEVIIVNPGDIRIGDDYERQVTQSLYPVRKTVWEEIESEACG